MESKQKIPIINVVLIVMLILCSVIGISLIVLSKSKVELIGRSGDSIKNNYTSTEDTSNTWDISVNEDRSVMATLSDDGKLIISDERTAHLSYQ